MFVPPLFVAHPIPLRSMQSSRLNRDRFTNDRTGAHGDILHSTIMPNMLVRPPWDSRIQINPAARRINPSNTVEGLSTGRVRVTAGSLIRRNLPLSTTDTVTTGLPVASIAVNACVIALSSHESISNTIAAKTCFGMRINDDMVTSSRSSDIICDIPHSTLITCSDHDLVGSTQSTHALSCENISDVSPITLVSTLAASVVYDSKTQTESRHTLLQRMDALLKNHDPTTSAHGSQPILSADITESEPRRLQLPATSSLIIIPMTNANNGVVSGVEVVPTLVGLNALKIIKSVARTDSEDIIKPQFGVADRCDKYNVDSLPLANQRTLVVNQWRLELASLEQVLFEFRANG